MDNVCGQANIVSDLPSWDRTSLVRLYQRSDDDGESDKRRPNIFKTLLIRLVNIDEISQ